MEPFQHYAFLIMRVPAGVASKHVLLTWGRGDTFSPETTMSNTALAAGLLIAEPVVSPITGLTLDARPVNPNVVGGDGPTRFGAVFQYDGAMAFDGHFVATRANQAISDWRAFLVSAATGTPSVP
jgi:hypothetical protein